jgi:hypothetical protein
VLRLPGWLAFLVFFPLQLFLAIKLWGSYGFWATLGILVVVAIVATRAARVHWFKAYLFPNYAMRWEQRRHVFQGILFLGAAFAWSFVALPQPWFPSGLHEWLSAGYPWLPLALVTSLVKATLR